MSPTVLYRIASVLLVLFAIGHTVGFVKFKPSTPEGVAVLEAMNNVHFPVKSAQFTYGQIYKGFGFFASAYLLFTAYLAWFLGSLAMRNPNAIVPLGVGFRGAAGRQHGLELDLLFGTACRLFGAVGAVHRMGRTATAEKRGVHGGGRTIEAGEQKCAT